MSSTIDERVVEMRFDNKQFEDNIQDSIASLDELKRSLDLNTSATKLNNVIRIFNGVKSVVGGVTRGALSLVNHTKNFVGQLTGVSSLFGRLRSEVAQTVQALTGGGIQAGFQEYELKLNSVRTILSNVERSGKNLGDVSDALEKLNKYADQTIYNFGEMTRNIGYFTVAGVDLDKSVAAIKGFSNLAALSGVDSTRAARATYQLSQAMSTGSVRLMDWRSMENAGMGGQQFQDLLIEIAKKSGVQYDALLKKHKSFRETLQKGWLTSDIMLKTLQIYSGDFGDDFIDHMDGINADTIEASFAAKAYREALEGNSEALDRYGLKLEDLQKIESKEDRYKMIAQAIAATDITQREAETVDYLTKKYGLSIEEARKYYDIAVKANEAAKEVTTLTKLLDALKEAAQSGWSASWEIVVGNLDEAKKIWTAVNDEIGGILQKHADNRNELLKKWKELGGRDSLFSSISNFYFGIKGIAGHFGTVLGTMFKPLTAESLADKTKSLEKLSKTFYTFVYGDKEAGIESGLSKLTPLFTAIGNAIGFVRDSVSKLISRGWNAFVGFITNPNIGAGFSKIANGLSSIFQKLRNSEALTKLSNLFGSLLTPVANALGSALSWVADVASDLYSKLSKLGIIDSISRAFGTSVDWLTKQVDKIGGFFNKIAVWFSDSGKISATFEALIANPKEVLGGWLKKAFDSIKTVFSSFFTKAKEWGKNSPKILKDIGGFFVGLWDSVKGFFSQITKNTKFGEFVSKLKSRFMQLVDKIKPVFQTVWTKIKDTFNKIFGSKQGSGSVAGGGGGGAPGVSGGGGAPTGNPFFERLKGFFASIPGALKAAFTWLGDKLSTAWAWVKTTAIPKIVSFFKDVIAFVNETVIPLLNSIGFNRLAKGVDKLGTGIGDLGAAINNIAKAKKFESQVKKVREIAKVILAIAAVLAIITATIVVLSKIPKQDYKNVAEGLKYVGALIAGILVFAVAMAGITKLGGKEFVKTGDMLLKMAASIALMVIVIVAIRQLVKSGNVGELAIAAGIAFGMMVVMTMIGRFLNSSPGKHAGTTLLGMAGAIFIMTFCVKRIVKLVKTSTPDELADAMVIVAALGGILTLMARLIGNGTGDLKKSSAFLIAAAGSIFLMTIVLGSVIDMIRTYSVGELIGGVALMAALAGIVAGMGWLLNSAKGTQWGSSAVLIAAVGAVYTLVIVLKSVIKLIKSENDGTIWHAIGILAALGGIIAGMGFILNSAKGVKWTSSFVLVAAAGAIWAMYALLSVVTKFVQNNNAGDIWHAYAIIAALGVLVTAMSLLLGNLKGIKVTSIATLALTVVVLGAMVGLLAIVKKMTKYQKTAGDLWKSYGVILALGGLVTAMSMVLGRGFETVSWGSLIKGVVTMTVAVAALVVVCSAIKSLASMDQKSLINASGSLVAILVGVIASVWALNKIGWRSAMKGTLILAAITAIFTGFVIGLGYLFNDIDGLEARFEKGKETLRSIGEAIGGFFGGIASGVSDSYPAIGTNLTTFGKNASGFFDDFMPKLAKFKMEDFQKLTEFTGALGNLGTDKWKNEFSLDMGIGWDTEKDVGSNIFDILASRFTRKKSLSDVFTMKQDFTEYATALSGLMTSIQSFMAETAKFTPEQMGAVNNSFTMVRDFLNGLDLKLPTLADVNTDISGGKASLGKLGEGLLGKIFGNGKMGASYATTGIDASIKQNFVDLGTMLSSVLDAADDFMINVSSKVSDDKFVEIKTAFDTVSGFIKNVSGLTLPDEETLWGGAGFGKIAGQLLTGAAFGYAKKTEFSALGAGLKSVLEGASLLIDASESISSEGVDFTKDIKPAFDAVTGLLSSVSELELPRELTKMHGGLALVLGQLLSGGAVEFDSEAANTKFTDLATGLSSILEATKELIKASDEIKASDGVTPTGIKDAFDNVTNLLASVSELDLPRELTKTHLDLTAILGIFASGGQFSLDTEAKNTTFTDLATGLTSILGATKDLIAASKLIDAEEGLTSEAIETAFDNVAGLLKTVSKVKLPPELTKSSWDLGGFLAIAGGKFKFDSETTNTNFTEMATGVGAILKSCVDVINAAKDAANDGVSSETMDGALTAVTNLLSTVANFTLPNEVQKSTESKVGLVKYNKTVNNVNTKFTVLVSGIQDIIGSVTGFVTEVTSTDGKADEAVAAMTSLGDFMKTISQMQTPKEKLEIQQGVHDWVNEQYSTFTSFVAEIKNLIGVFTNYTRDISSFTTLEDDGKSSIEKSTDSLVTFINSLNGFKTPEEVNETKFGVFKSTIGTYNTKFTDMVASISGEGGLLSSFGSFISSVKSLTDSEQTSVTTAVTDLVTFLNAISDLKPPKTLSREWFGVSEEFTTIGDIANALPDLGTKLGKFYTNFSDIEGSVEAFGSLYDIMGGESAKSAAVVGFLSDSVSLLKNLWGLNDQYGTLEDKYWIDPDAIGNIVGKLGDFVEALSESVDDGDLDYAFGKFADFGSKIFEKITAGFSNTDSITTLRDALSTALTTALTPDAMPDEVGSFDSVIAQINALLEEGIDTAPTIRPVLDLSQLTADVKSMDELFAAGGIIHMSSSKQNAEEANMLSAQLSQHTSTVVNAINSMGTKIDNLGNSIKNIKIVLNTGILAGAMAPDMDKALGARSDSTRRGSATSSVPSYVV